MARSIRTLTTGLALALAGAGLAVSGLVLLLRAAWIAIAAPLGPVWASTLLGSVLLLIGVLVVTITLLSMRRSPARHDGDLIAALVSAFLQGLAAGRTVRHR